MAGSFRRQAALPRQSLRQSRSVRPLASLGRAGRQDATVANVGDGRRDGVMTWIPASFLAGNELAIITDVSGTIRSECGPHN